MLETIPGGLGQFLDKGMFIGTVALIVIAYLLGWWVSGREHRSIVKDRDYWRDAATLNSRTAANVTNERAAAMAHLEAIVTKAHENDGGGDP